MFGFGVPKLPDDPVKMALLTTGLSMLASGDPQQTMKSLPQIMGAALQAREQRKYRKAQQEFEKQKFELQKRQADLKMQAYEQERERQRRLAELLGLGGGQQTPQLSQPQQNVPQQPMRPAPGSLAGPAQPPQAPQTVPPQTPPVAVPGSVAGAQQQAHMTQEQQVAVEKAKQDPGIMGSVKKAIMQLDPATRAYIASNPKLMDNIILKTITRSAGLGGSGSKPSASSIINMVRLDKNNNPVDRKVIDLSSPEGRAEFNALRQQGFLVTKDIPAKIERPGVKAMNTEIGKKLAKDMEKAQRMNDLATQFEFISREFVKDPKNYTGPLADQVLSLKKLAEGMFGIKIPGSDTSEIMDMIMRKAVYTESGGFGKAVSDSDRNFIVAMLPSMKTTPGGIIAFTVMAKKMAQAEQERINFINDQLDKGKSSREAVNAWNRLMKQKRLFNDKKSFAKEVADYMDSIGYSGEGRSIWEQFAAGEKSFEDAAKEYRKKPDMKKAYSEFRMKHPDIAKRLTPEQFRKAVETGAIKIGGK